MLTTRLMTTAFLLNRGQCLMMKRADTRVFAPGGWAGVGGHIEAFEYSEPRFACAREIEEETGLKLDDLSDFRLKYIVHRLRRGEIRQQYVYFGSALKREVIQTSEGELHWIDLDAVLALETSRTTQFIFEHFFEHGDSSGDVHVGVLFSTRGDAQVRWTPLQDWE